MRDVRISSIQLAFIIIGFTFGEAAILNPSSNARQDAWLVNVLALIGGLILVSVYTTISSLHPGKTLIDILRATFGRYAGNFVAILYLWYFIHVLSLVLRSFMEFMASTLYIRTPILFMAICLMIVALYTVKKGLEVIARVSELLVPMLIVTIIFLFLALITEYDIQNFLPFLEFGMRPVLKASVHMTTFPFGETVVFLMIFPHLNNKSQTFKISLFSILSIGIILLSVTTRDLLVLGPDMLERMTYPNYASTKMMPIIDIEAFIATNLLIGGGVKIVVLLYAISMGIAQFFKLDDYKPLVLPVSFICISLSLWIFDSLIDKILWEETVYPYYAIPFQLIIPLLILIISLMKKKKLAE
ncbi:MAG: endospore germination permease [Peptostreptococcales bacterium]